MAYNSKYTGAEVEALLDKVQDGAAGGGLWNVYCFVGGTADSVVTIDGENITVAAGATVQGSFVDDISAIPTNNLRRIIIRGDVSLSICTSSSSANSTLEEVDIEFSPSFVRSLDYFCYNLRASRRLRVAGGKVSGAQYMCAYVGANTDAGCIADLHGIDFSAMTSDNGCQYLCFRGKWESVDLSGSTFNGDANYLFSYATVQRADVSGSTFQGNAIYLFRYATVQRADVSGCTFGGSATYMFGYATVGSADVSGSTFNGDANYLFRYATVGSADVSGSTFHGSATYMFGYATVGSADVSGSTFNGDANYLFNAATVGSADVSGSTFQGNAIYLFRAATIQRLSLAGADLSAASNDNTYMWTEAQIESLDLDGITLPTNVTYCWNFINYMNSATKIGTITGDWGEMTDDRDIALSSLELRRNSTVGLFNALCIASSTLTISAYSGARVTDYDIAIATNKGWTVAY